jgi:hypothetical protein
VRIIFLSLALAASLPAEWKLFRSGPVEVVTDGPDRAARAALNHLEQVQHLAGHFLGKPDAQPLWPVRIVLSKNIAARGDLFLGSDAYVAAEASPRIFSAYARQIIEASVPRMPVEIEDGLADLLGAIAADGPKVKLGMAPRDPSAGFPLVQMLATRAEYSGRFRVFLTNLQQGATLDIASRNAFEKPFAEIQRQAAAHRAAGRFEAIDTPGKPIAPERAYRERPIDQALARAYAAEVSKGEPPNAADLAAGAAEGSDNARAFFAKASLESDPAKARPLLMRAAELNPRWAAPHARLAELEPDLARRIPHLRKAAKLNPRDAAMWETLATAQRDGRLFADAAESFRNAERAAPDEATRAAIEMRRREYDQRRLELEAAERRRIEEEKQQELARLKQEALDRIREAEERANASPGKNNPQGKVVGWWDGPRPDGKLSGSLEKVDCLRGAARLHIRDGEGKTAQILIADPSGIVLTGGGEMSLGCGPQKPARAVSVEYTPRKDPKFGTTGDAALIEFKP